MGCEDCDKIQELNLLGKSIAYTRVGAATVIIGACDKHFRQLSSERGVSYPETRPVHRIIDLNYIKGEETNGRTGKGSI